MNNAFETLRAMVERDLAPHSAILVSSALPRDGKTAVAAGLAEVLSEAGYRTAVVDANNARPSIGARLGCRELLRPSLDLSAARTVYENIDVLSVAEAHVLSKVRADIHAFVGALRLSYDFTIFDGGELAGSVLALAPHVDGILVAVRENRSATRADRDVSTLLERLDVPFLGVVATTRSRKAIPRGPRRPLPSERRSLAAVPAVTSS